MSEDLLEGECAGESDVDSSDADGDPSPDFEQPGTQCRCLGFFQHGSAQCESANRDDPQGCSHGPPQAQFVAAEVVATGSVSKEAELFVDAVFHFAARAGQLFIDVALVELGRRK